MVFLRYGGLFWSSIPAPPYPPIWNGILLCKGGFKMRPANKIVVWRPLLLAKFRPQLKMFSGQKNSSFPHVVIFLSLCLVPQCSVNFWDRDNVCLFVLIESLNWRCSPGWRIQVFHMWLVIFLSLCFVPQCSVIFTKGTMFVCFDREIRSLVSL